MNITRDRLIRALATRGRATIVELAKALQVGPTSVRHHLASLQAEGLVQSTEVRHGIVGRPNLVYSLTDRGRDRFTPRYLEFTERLLDELKATLPPETLSAILSRMASGIVAKYGSELQGKNLDERMRLLGKVLGEEGFLAEWSRAGETIFLIGRNCPYTRIGRRHPEVCTIDRTMIQEMLAAHVEKTTCLLQGAERCAFVITPEAQPQSGRL
jgi:predicted ArsR family transcriptional regulator